MKLSKIKHAEVYSKLFQTSKADFFTEIVKAESRELFSKEAHYGCMTRF